MKDLIVGEQGEATISTLVRESPELALHAFACDCAQRAIWRESQLGTEVDARCVEALECKRRWLEGEATAGELLTMSRRAEKVWVTWQLACRDPSVGVVEQAFVSVLEAVFWAVHVEAKKAALQSSAAALWVLLLRAGWGPVARDEQVWQVERLRWLSQMCGWAGQRMLFLIREGKLPEPQEVGLCFVKGGEVAEVAMGPAGREV